MSQQLTAWNFKVTDGMRVILRLKLSIIKA